MLLAIFLILWIMLLLKLPIAEPARTICVIVGLVVSLVVIFLGWGGRPLTIGDLQTQGTVRLATW